MSTANRTKQTTEKLHSSVYKKALLALAALAALGVLIYSVSTAWYSNVAETKGMVFETDSWGFEGQVQVLNEDDPIAPGSSGYISLQISNDSNQINRLYVGADKSGMSQEIQKRIYFYAPAATKVGDETVSRVYLSPYSSYSYTVMPKTTLLLTRDYTAATPVCYEWVYDLEGYYVYGTLSQANGQYVLTGKDSATDPVYIRPVTYDLTKATFDPTSGRLLTVDGTTTPQQFLAKIAQTDGYEGSIGAEVGSSGYYPVSVKTNADGSQTGVWVYLCSQVEVQSATELDTRIGEYAALVKNGQNTDDYNDYKDIQALKYDVRIQITAQNLRAVETNVTSQEALLSALAEASEDDSYQKISVMSDVELTEPLKVAENRNVVLELNGKTIAYKDAAGTNAALDIAPSSQVTVMNGTINATDGTDAVHAIGASVSFSDMTIQGRLLIDDSDERNSENMTSAVRLYNSKLVAADADKVGIHVFGNGIQNSQTTTLIVDSSTVEGGYMGICGNGSTAYYGTDIQINNSTVKGKWAGIYQPQRDSKLRVEGNSFVEGFTALAIKGGTVVVRDSTITATATADASDLIKNPTDSQLGRNGFADTGAAVYVEANYTWADSIRVEINGSTVRSQANTAVLVLGPQKDKVILTQVDVKQ